METVQKEMLLESLAKFNTCEVVVSGTSMWPFIRSGDTISIRHKPEKYSLGSVIAFFNEDQLIVHRVIWHKKIACDEWEIFVHGDASPCSTVKIKPDHIIGTVEYVKRHNTIITLSFNDPYRIIAIPLGFILQFLVSIKTGIRRKMMV